MNISPVVRYGYVFKEDDEDLSILLHLNYLLPSDYHVSILVSMPDPIFGIEPCDQTAIIGVDPNLHLHEWTHIVSELKQLVHEYPLIQGYTFEHEPRFIAGFEWCDEDDDEDDDEDEDEDEDDDDDEYDEEDEEEDEDEDEEDEEDEDEDEEEEEEEEDNEGKEGNK